MNAFFRLYKSLWVINKKIFSLLAALFYLVPSSLCSVEMMMWHRYIGADSTGTGEFISYLYSPDSGYDQFSLPSGLNDNSNFIIQNSNEIACAGSIAAGSYTITLEVSNGFSHYQQNIDFRVVAGSYQPKISAGYYHLVVLTSSGEIYSTGKGSDGALGLGDWSNYNSLQLVNGSGSALENEAIFDLYAGVSATYFLTREGAIFATGTDSTGKFGINGSSSVNTAMELTSLTSQKIVQIATYENHTACLTYNGTVLMFGQNDYGQLGLNNTTNYSTATSVQAATNTIDSVFVVSVKLGRFHSALLGSNSNIYTSGRNHKNQLSRTGEGDQFYTTTLSSCNRLWAGNHQLFALSGSGNDLYSAGWNFYGSLGLGSGSTHDQAYNFSAADLSSVSVLQIASHTQAAYLISDSGDVYVFGENNSNVLTNNYGLDNPAPTLLNSSEYDSKTASQVTLGRYFAALLTEDGSIYTCGLNTSGQLGLGVGNSTVNTLNEITSFSAGANERLNTDQSPTLAETFESIATFSVGWNTYALGIVTAVL